MAQEQKTSPAQLSQAFMVQLQTANHKVSALIDQRQGLLEQLTEIQVLHRIESANRKALQDQLNEAQVALAQSQEKTLSWVDAAKIANDKVAALTWYCEQLLKQSPDSNGIHTIDNSLLGDILKTHQAVLTGERISTNIEDVIRVTTGAQLNTPEEAAETDEETQEKTSAPEADVVELDHGLSKADEVKQSGSIKDGQDSELTEEIDVDIEIEEAVRAKPLKKKKG